MRKKLFKVSILFSIIFMIYAIVEVSKPDAPTPSALFYLLMPPLLLGFAYHDPFVSKLHNWLRAD